MFGKNPKARQGPEHPEVYKVKEVFATFQGEGPYAGWPAVFVRMGGCNLHCFYCDTDFTEDLVDYSPAGLVGDINAILGNYPGIGLVVFTGGEPMLQDLRPILHGLHRQHPALRFQVETAGTVVWPEWPHDLVDLVVSPKTPKVRPEIAVDASAWKYILRAGEVDPNDGLPAYSTQVEGKTQPVARPTGTAPVYVQPCEEYGPSAQGRTVTNTQVTIEAAMEFGYRISLQQHKFVNMP